MDKRTGEDGETRAPQCLKRATSLYRGLSLCILVVLWAFVTVDVLVENPNVKPGMSQKEKLSLLQSHRYFFAALLKNNDNVADNWTHQLVRTIDALKPAPVYVSIVENGDSSDNTSATLKSLKTRLEKLGIKNTIITDRVRKLNGRDRIVWLSELRNLALEPLQNLGWDVQSTRVVFLNDVWFHSQDIIELITTNRGDYDMCCALDFYWKFYDGWVSRDLKGMPLYGGYPYFQDFTARTQIRDLEPVRVFSCWNGAVVMKAEPFMQNPKVEFRASQPDKLMQSECFWVCYDFWNAGYHKILINPRVILAYERRHYYYQKYLFPAFVHPFSRLYIWLTTPSSLQNPDSADLATAKVPRSALGWKNYL